MNGNKSTTDSHDIRAADRGLQPRTVVEGGVPVTDGSVIAAKGDLEIVVVVITNDVALDFDGVAGGLRVESHFTKVSNFPRQRGRQVQIELPQIEATVRSFLIGGGKVHIAKSTDLQGGIMLLHLLNGGDLLPDFVFVWLGCRRGSLLLRRLQRHRAFFGGGGDRSRRGRRLLGLQVRDAALQLLNSLEQ